MVKSLAHADGADTRRGLVLNSQWPHHPVLSEGKMGHDIGSVY